MILKLLNAMGPRWALQRIKFAAEHKTGALKRRMPQRQWHELKLADLLREDVSGDAAAYFAWRESKTPAFFFSSGALPRPFNSEAAVESAECALRGEMPFFGHTQQTGFPPNWHRDVLSGTEWPRERHWSEIDDFQLGDIKLIWEPSRFLFVYPLVRGYAATHDDRYAAAFWHALEDWLENNPPHSGVNWKCGQEATFRLMAWCFGLYAFASSPETTAERAVKITLAIAMHGERIAGHIEYALSQRNNHGLSEAVGLFTIGTLFPELRRAAEWRKRGRKLIEQQASAQFYPDGSYIQHSFNYQRVAMHVLMWAMRLGELAGAPFSNVCYEAMGRSAMFLSRFCDARSGALPNYGHNDGSLILPLADVSYDNFHPTLQAAHLLAFGEKHIDEAGPWDELSQWLGLELRVGPLKREELALSPTSGYIGLAVQNSHAMLRAAQYADRPAHADQLHFDLWFKSENIACDPGTYAYNGPEPWKNALAATRFHNTLTIGGHDQMTRASRFLWLDWAQAGSARYAADSKMLGPIEAAQAKHVGYRRLRAFHRRWVICLTRHDCWLVLDRVHAPAGTTSRLHWLCAADKVSCACMERRNGLAALHLTVAASAPLQIAHVRGGSIRADSGRIVDAADAELYGWIAPDYMERREADSFLFESAGDVRYASIFAPHSVDAIVGNSRIQFRVPHLATEVTIYPENLLMAISSASATEQVRLVEIEEPHS